MISNLVTAYISIGNSDDKLTQYQWANFVHETTRVSFYEARDMYFKGFSEPGTPFQNMCIGVSIPRDKLSILRHKLSGLASKYGQDSIALAIVENTELILPPNPGSE